MSEETKNTNETRLRNAGLRMALKLIPADLMKQAPTVLEKYIAESLKDVSPRHNESGACYMISPDDHTGAMRVMLVTLDEACCINRILKVMTVGDLFNKILEGIKEL